MRVHDHIRENKLRLISQIEEEYVRKLIRDSLSPVDSSKKEEKNWKELVVERIIFIEK